MQIKPIVTWMVGTPGRPRLDSEA